MYKGLHKHIAFLSGIIIKIRSMYPLKYRDLCEGNINSRINILTEISNKITVLPLYSADLKKTYKSSLSHVFIFCMNQFSVVYLQRANKPYWLIIFT